MKTVAIIGGGAAGMMAAARISEHVGAAPNEKPPRVLLFEKNAYLGAKVLISGGGRCNVTTGITDVCEMLKNYPRGSKFLMTAMYRFPPAEVIKWFENHGVKLKIEEDMRVFPFSNKGKDVVGALESAIKKQNTEILCGTQVLRVEKSGIAFKIFSNNSGEKNEEKSYIADILVLTTGGNAYGHTGSTGDGYDFAKTLGHTITQLGPSLSALTSDEVWLKSLAGISFGRVSIELKTHKGKYSRSGAFLFTHNGVTGPAIFALSSFAAFDSVSKDFPAVLKINLFPDENLGTISNKIDELIKKNPRKKILNLLDVLLPKSLCGIFMARLNLPNDLTASHLNREQRDNICDALTGFSIKITGRSAGEEFVTAGGVDNREVNTNTMESKICQNLFFAGEILNVDGFTGGFNLQASWATGSLAGEETVKRLTI